MSHDNQMGDDSVIECVNFGGSVTAYTSYTVGRTGAFRTDIVSYLMEV